jgi:iron complex outermembrane receptor protein
MIAGLAIAAIPGLALAQATETPATEPAAAAAAAPAAAAPADDTEELVVTGSRIRRTEFTSTSPIQVITSEQSTLEGLVDTAKIIQGSSVAGNDTQINNFFTGFVVNGGPGVNTVSLRGLGTQRTLLLLNGRRAGPAGTRGSVGAFDLNTLPSSIIDRVEVLKDGASSVYGSDAVAGVINIITSKKLDGGEAGVYANLTADGGGEEYRANVAQGWTFEKGYLNLAADYYRQEALTFGDRDYFSCPQDYVFNPATGFRLDIIDPVTGTYKCQNTLSGRVDNQSTGRNYVYDATAVAGGGIGNTDLNGLKRVGATFAGNPTNTRASAALSPTNDPRLKSRHAISPVERYTLAANGSFDLTANTELYGELLLNRRESSQDSWRQLFPTVHFNNPNNIFRVGNPSGYAPGYARSVILMPSNGEQTVDYTRVVVGAKGMLPDIGFLKGWDWDIYGQYSKSHGEYSGNFIYNDRVLATTGASACNTALLKTATACPTGGVNYFRQSTVTTGAFTPEEAAFLFGTETGTTDYTHQYIEGSISGNLFTLPAGPIGAALGFQVRKEEIDDTPGEQARTNNLWGSSSAGRTAGSDTIKEIFGELEIPVLRGVPLAESLTVNLSGRRSDYQSYGANSTYKVGVNWQILPSIRLRGSDGTSFRAPALYELFLANQTGFLGQTSIDPCVNWGEDPSSTTSINCAKQGIPSNYTAAGTSSALIITGGGKGNLDAETSKARSLGFIWTPSFVDLNIAVDYFDIEIENQVAQFGAANIVSACYALPTFPNNDFCSLFTRDVTAGSTTQWAITSVRNNYVNVQRQSQRGLDLTTRFTHQFAGSKLTIDSQFSWILDWQTQLLSDTETKNNGLVGSPDFNGSVNTRYDKGDWTYFWGMDVVSKSSDTDYYGTDVFNNYKGTGVAAYYKQHAEFQITHNVSIRKKFDKWTAEVGIQNLFDEQPPYVSTGTTRVGNAALNSSYDFLGRRMFFNVSRRW